MDRDFPTPKFIEYLIKGGYIEDDGALPVSYTPITIGTDNADLMADVINNGSSQKYLLPIVFVSLTQDGKAPLDAALLAKNLRGLAHVLVQKDAATGSEINSRTNEQNNFDGTVNVYYSNPKHNSVYSRQFNLQ
jgi:hypothetical protein